MQLKQNCQISAETALKMTPRKARTESEASEEISALRLSASVSCQLEPGPVFAIPVSDPYIIRPLPSLKSDPGHCQ